LKELILGNQHTGNIPPQLGNLSNLERLDLESNQLSGNIPPELGNLVNLEVLNLSKNQLSGSIPSQLGNLNNLLDLRLDKNQLSQNIPSQLGNLSNLKYLNLSNNQLSGSIPSQLGNLQKLSILELSGNQLSGNIPHELGKLYYLDWLFLNSNRLTGSIPPELGKIGWVSKLSLDNNQLSGSIPPELGNLSMLIYLHLENNLLSGSIPSSLGRMRNLWFLYLNNNQLDGNIPPSLGTGHLHGIYLNHNQLSGNIPPELGNFWNWGEIYLNNNRLNGDIPSSLTNLVNIAQFDIGYNCLHASDKDLRAWLDIHDPDWEIHQDQCGGTQPIISLNRSRLYFCALTPAYQTFTGSQEVWISNSGLESLNWNIHTDSSWLTCTPLSGIDSGIITISVNPAGLSEGTYSGTITISDSHAANAPQYISVTLKIKPNSEEMLPFGAFLTPVDNSNVCSSIPVTGWVLDDIGIQSVKIYREEGTLLHFIGNAEFMDSARPDIEMAYLDYPFNYKAGWGYMMLTNSLPDGGNGVFKLHALATDVNGNIVNLGVKTITVDNANAVKPFGYIDSPVQCGVTSGKNVINWGWVLTPRPRYIPTDGSTISVWVDGVSIGHPTYNLYREDIAGKFPGYANSNGAVGYFYLDTTAFQNGIHTLFWTAVDNAGNTDGIGSRYFTILNRKQHSSFSASHNSCPGLNEELPGLFPGFHPLLVKTGYNNEVNPREIYPDEEGFSHILCRELERIEITMKDPGTPSSCFNGYLVVGEKLRPLPTGSTLDAGKGVFYWQPGPGFIGTYHLAFVEKDETGMINRKEVIVEIEPKYPVMENYVQKKVKYNQGSE
jgi:Leucine-rich repeat (LRR) protein